MLATSLAVIVLPSAITGCGVEISSSEEAASSDEGTTATLASALTTQLIFSDEFNDGSLDRSKWVPSDGSKNPSANSGSCFNNESSGYKDHEGCGSGDPGLSTSASSIAPHAVMCTNNGGTLSGDYHETLQVSASNMIRPNPPRLGDWDNGYYKSECHNGQYVSGISQSTSGQIRGVRCAAGSLTNGGRNSCETRLVSGSDDRGNSSTGDWDSGYHKGECSANKIVYGVSVHPTSKKPHRILCCDR